MKHTYTEAEEKYISNFKGSIKELQRAFNKEFGTNLSYSAMAQKRNSMSVRCFERIDFTDDMWRWLEEHIQDMNWNDLTRAFCKQFDVSISLKGLNRRCYQKGMLKYNREHYTQEQIAWIGENVCNFTFAELAKEFNRIYGTHSTQGAVTQIALKKGALRGENRFAHNVKAIGEEVTKHGNIVYVKIKDIGGKTDMWRPKKDVIYQEHFGAIPEGYTVIHLDKNKSNFDIDNLYAVDKKVLATMNLNRWYGESREINITGIKVIEIERALKGVTNDSNT